MSSFVKRIAIAGLLLASTAAAAAVLTPDQRAWYGSRLGVGYSQPPSAMPASDPVAESLVQWRRLSQSDSYAFSDYARFLGSNPGWPGELAMRRAAERRIDANSFSHGEVVAFFTRLPPLTNAGEARFADALMASGRVADAQAAARRAWTGGTLTIEDETRLLSRFGGALSPGDHDRRMEGLLWDRASGLAQRQLAWTSAARRPMYEARLALQSRAPDALTRASAVGAGADRDPGFIVDKARYLRDSMQSFQARSYLARPRSLDAQPYDPEKWFEVLLTNARAAANDSQWTLAFDIARQLDDAYAPATDIRERPIGERDEYTSLAWLAGTTALDKLGRARDAIGMFDRYARAARSPQTQSKGWYWAGRAAQAAGDATTANSYFTQAAQHNDQFYGQLANERLGRAVPPLVEATSSVTPGQLAAFEASPIVRAAIILGEIGAWRDQSQFLRAIANNAKTADEHRLAADLSLAINRPDLGVMIARSAGVNGLGDYARAGFPQVSVPGPMARHWTMIHAISRQESQFDREATSSAGALGLMQLMPGTARETAGKLGLSYDNPRLRSDPSYNIMLGSTYFANMLDYYGGSYPLAVAAYNAGPGNVNKWIRANGDPRMSGMDMVSWIEAIPIFETRNYVQRVLENAVVYDGLNPGRATMSGQYRLSGYLGKRQPG
jgi:soluble lytic murein transglycosylase